MPSDATIRYGSRRIPRDSTVTNCANFIDLPSASLLAAYSVLKKDPARGMA